MGSRSAGFRGFGVSTINAAGELGLAAGAENAGLLNPILAFNPALEVECGADAINVLVECLREPDQNLRWVAAFALRNAVSPRTTFIIDSLKEVLATDDLKLKRMDFLTLAEFGPAAAKVVPELKAALESPDPTTREVARASLACIEPDGKTASTIRVLSRLIELALAE